jgi:hypothetical protein
MKFGFSYFGSVPVITEVTVYKFTKPRNKKEKRGKNKSSMCASPRRCSGSCLSLHRVDGEGGGGRRAIGADSHKLGANHHSRHSHAWIRRLTGGVAAALALVGQATSTAALLLRSGLEGTHHGHTC